MAETPAAALASKEEAVEGSPLVCLGVRVLETVPSFDSALDLALERTPSFASSLVVLILLEGHHVLKAFVSLEPQVSVET